MNPPRSPRFTAGKRFRLLAFFVAYFLFLLPVFVALFREFSSRDGKRGNALVLPIMHPGGQNFLVALAKWLGLQLGLYPVFRLVARRLGCKLHEKTLAKHKDDILRLCYWQMALCAVGGISIRIEEGITNTETGLTFIPLVLVYIVFYTCIFELVKDRDITLSVGLLSNGPLNVIVVLIGVLTMIAVSVSLFLTAKQVGDDFFVMYVGVTAVVFVLHVLLFLPVVPGVPSRSFLHVHHWYFPIPLMHMCLFHTDVSMISQAIFLAVHIHGVDCFGIEPLFYDSERRARHPSDFDWVLKEHAHEPRPFDQTFEVKNTPDVSPPMTPDVNDEETSLMLRAVDALDDV